MIVTAIVGGTNGNTVAIGEWELYGTEEGDESVDVVHRSVPNKPGTQHLEVYWDANDSNSYSFADSSNVYDLSGNGVTGAIAGTNGFDAEYNAWVFDGTGDRIAKRGATSLSGNAIHTHSAWFKLAANIPTTSSYYGVICGLYEGDDGSAPGTGEASVIDMNQGLLEFGVIGAAVQFYRPAVEQWYHVAVAYPGTTVGGAEFYVNGERISTTISSSNPTNTMDLGSTAFVF